MKEPMLIPCRECREELDHPNHDAFDGVHTYRADREAYKAAYRAVWGNLEGCPR